MIIVLRGGSHDGEVAIGYNGSPVYYVIKREPFSAFASLLPVDVPQLLVCTEERYARLLDYRGSPVTEHVFDITRTRDFSTQDLLRGPLVSRAQIARLRERERTVEATVYEVTS